MSGADGGGARRGRADWRRTVERAAPAVACLAVMAVADPSTWWGWTLWLIALVALVRMVTSAAWRASLDPRRAEGPDGLPLPESAAPGAGDGTRPPARDAAGSPPRASGGADDDDLPWVLGVGGATIWVEEVGHAPLALVHVVRAYSGRDRARALRAVAELPGPLFSGLDPDAAESLADALRRAGARVGVASLVPPRRARWWDVAWWDVPWWSLLARRWTDARLARARAVAERGAEARRAVERGAVEPGPGPVAGTADPSPSGAPSAGAAGADGLGAHGLGADGLGADGLCCRNLRALLVVRPGGPGIVVRLGASGPPADGAGSGGPWSGGIGSGGIGSGGSRSGGIGSGGSRSGGFGPGGFGLRGSAGDAPVPIWRCPWCGAWLDGLR